MNVNNDRLQVYLLLYFRLPVVADDHQQPSSAIRSTPICHNARVYFFASADKDRKRCWRKQTAVGPQRTVSVLLIRRWRRNDMPPPVFATSDADQRVRLPERCFLLAYGVDNLHKAVTQSRPNSPQTPTLIPLSHMPRTALIDRADCNLTVWHLSTRQRIWPTRTRSHV